MAASLRSFRREDAERVVELSRATLARPEFQVGNPIWTTLDELRERARRLGSAARGDALRRRGRGQRSSASAAFELPSGFEHAELFGPLVAADARGHRLGTRTARGLDRPRGGRRARRSLVGAIGTRNAAGRILLERHGFRRRGRPQATFRLRPDDHRPLARGSRGVVVRVATRDDLPAALELYRECFPGGRFPEARLAREPRRRNRLRGRGGRRDRRRPEHRPERPLDLPRRRHRERAQPRRRRRSSSAGRSSSTGPTTRASRSGSTWTPTTCPRSASTAARASRRGSCSRRSSATCV